jgi:hypothetical protein
LLSLLKGQKGLHMAAITATDPLTTVNHMQGTDLDGLTDLLGLSWANVYPAGTAGQIFVRADATNPGVSSRNATANQQTWYVDKAASVGAAMDVRATVKFLLVAGGWGTVNSYYALLGQASAVPGTRTGYYAYMQHSGSPNLATYGIQARSGAIVTLLGTLANQPANTTSLYRLWLAIRPNCVLLLCSTDGGNNYQLMVLGQNTAATPPTLPPLAGKVGAGGIAFQEQNAVADDAHANGLIRDYACLVPPSTGFVASLYQCVANNTAQNVTLISNTTQWLAGTSVQINNNVGSTPTGATIVGTPVVNTDAWIITLQINPGTSVAGGVFGIRVNNDPATEWPVQVVPDTSTVGVVVYPRSDTAVTAGLCAFRAAVINDAAPPGGGVTWLAGAGGGTADATGIYHAPAQTGTDTMQATSVKDATKAATAQVNVTLAPLPQITIIPSTLTVQAGQSYPFSYTLNDPHNPGVSWSTAPNNLGSITPAGLYTAPASVPTGQVLTDTVTVTSLAGSPSATATVTVTPAIAISITPSEVVLVIGQSTTFTAAVANADVNPGILWSATGGVLAASGTTATYTAPTLPGVYTVSAQSAQDPTKVATAQVQVVLSQTARISLYTAGPYDYITVQEAVVVSPQPTAGYSLYTGSDPTHPGEVPIDTVLAPATFPFTFRQVATAAPGQRKYYTVRAFDATPPPDTVYSPPSNVVSSATSDQQPTGQTYEQVFVASYGAQSSGLGASLGFTVFDNIGAVLTVADSNGTPVAGHTLGLAENPGSGVYSITLQLDYGYTGYVQLDDPTGTLPTVQPFGPQPVSGAMAGPGAGVAVDPNSLWGHLRDIRAVVVARSRPNPQDGLDFYDPTGSQVVLTQRFNDTIPPTARDESRPSG